MEQEIERLQKKTKRCFVWMWICTGIVFVVSIVLLWLLLQQVPDLDKKDRIGGILILPPFLAIGTAVLCYLIFVRGAYKKFNVAFKSHYVLPTIESLGIFEDLQYQHNGGLSYTEVRNSSVVGCGEQRYYETEDLLTGSYRGTGFQYCDVKTQKMVVHGKERRLETIFEGQIMRFDSFDETKSSMGHLQLFEKEFLSDFKGRTAQNKIQTEDEAFNKRFQIYAADPHTAFYILTPKMIEQITHFADTVQDQIALTFTGTVLYVAVYRTRSMFDGQVTRPCSEQRAEILKDVEILRQAGEILLQTQR